MKIKGYNELMHNTVIRYSRYMKRIGNCIIGIENSVPGCMVFDGWNKIYHQTISIIWDTQKIWNEILDYSKIPYNIFIRMYDTNTRCHIRVVDTETMEIKVVLEIDTDGGVKKIEKW